MPEYNSGRLVLDSWSCSGVESHILLVSLYVKGSGCQVTGILDLASSPVATNWEQTQDPVPASILTLFLSYEDVAKEALHSMYATFSGVTSFIQLYIHYVTCPGASFIQLCYAKVSVF